MISDPQNIVASFVFLVTSIVASMMSERIRHESSEAHASKAELESLYRLSRALLQTDEPLQLTRTVPNAVAVATGAQAVLFFLLEGKRIYRSGSDWTPHLSEDALTELSHAPGIISSAGAHEAMIPLRTGVRLRGLLIIRGLELSHQSLEALGGLVSIALDRSSTIDQVARTEAAKENDRLRGLMLDSITHEFGVPLTFIESSLDGILAQNVEPGETRRLLDSVHEESKRLSRLVAQAVEMAKFDTQELQMSFASWSLGELISGALESAERELQGHVVQVTLAPRLPNVQVDPTLGPSSPNKVAAECREVFLGRCPYFYYC